MNFLHSWWGNPHFLVYGRYICIFFHFVFHVNSVLLSSGFYNRINCNFPLISKKSNYILNWDFSQKLNGEPLNCKNRVYIHEKFFSILGFVVFMKGENERIFKKMLFIIAVGKKKIKFCWWWTISTYLKRFAHCC